MSRKKKQQHTIKQSINYTGTLDIARSGIGYVVIAGAGNDVLVRPGSFANALHGDTVQVKIIKENQNSGKREGRILKAISRRQTQFTGVIHLSTNYAFFIPDTDRPMPDFYIPLENLNGAKNKDHVVAVLEKWDSDNRKPIGKIQSILEAGNENDVAMKSIIAENGFPLQFPEDVIKAAAKLSDKLLQKEIKKRKDCREIFTITIDPVDAKDFDDALSFRVLPNGMYEIGVHIADVSYYVEQGSILDTEAYKRATSVYLPDRVNPMLPERISNGLCSLRPNEDKFTFAAIFQIDAKGEIKQHWLGRTVIHSNRRFTYEEVQEIIENEKGENYNEINTLNTIAKNLRKQRFQEGAINFSSQEVRFVLDSDAKPIGITIKESKEAHQLVEEWMLLANKTVAAFAGKILVNKKQLPFPYRIHDSPDLEKLKPFAEYSKRYGHKFDLSSPEKIAHSFNQLLIDANGKPEQHVLEQLGIRTMAKAVYSMDNIGHYGLAFENYCHFTSPIRRYPDVLVHRILAECLAEKPMVDKDMEEKCKHCSERERAAMDAERASQKYKQVEYMKPHVGDVFEAVISGVSQYGFWAETVAHKCEGMVSIHGLQDYDDFRHIESDYCLAGHRSGRVFRMGDKIFIKVLSANMEKRLLDYEWVVNEAGSTPGKIKKSIKSEKGKRRK